MEHIRPFYETFIATHSVRECISAAYEFFLRRTPGESEIDGYEPRVPRPMTMDWFASLFLGCAEFSSHGGFPLPGPFDPAFPFGTEIL